MSEFGLFTIDRATRTASGYLIPYGVKSKGVSSSNTRPITFPPGSIRIPRDPMVVTLNDEHERFDVLGRAATLAPDDVGIYATFALADTDEVDEWISQHADGPVYFSAEIADLRRRPGDVGEGRLAGAAVTQAPAFDGTAAALFSLRGAEQDTSQDTSQDTLDIDVDEDDDDDEDDTSQDVSQDTPAAAGDESPGDPADNESESAMPEAMVPNATFSRRPKVDTPTLSRAGFFSAVRRARNTGDLSTLRPYLESFGAVGEDGEGLFALSDVAYDGAGGLAAAAGIPSGWLGELWSGNKFPRKVVPLLTPGVLTGIKASGWRWTTKPEVDEWTGNKTPIPSNPLTVEPQDYYAQRFAGGHDLAREYYDFNVTEVVDSYLANMSDSYGIKSDAYALTELKAGAGSFTPAAATANVGIAAVVDGALAVIDANATPSYALVASNVFRDILMTGHADALEYFNAAVSLTGADAGGFRIVPDNRLAAGDVIVGARQAATAWELPGVPIRISAPDLVKGGVDNAVFGYIAVGVEYPEGVVTANVTITTAAAAKSSTK